jgi:hypothetical protein
MGSTPKPMRSSGLRPLAARRPIQAAEIVMTILGHNDARGHKRRGGFRISMGEQFAQLREHGRVG